MTNEQLLAQAIRNEIVGLRRAIDRAEGRIDGLEDILGKLESGVIVAGGPPNDSPDSSERPTLLATSEEPNEASGSRSEGDSGDREGGAKGTDGGVE